MLTNNFEEYVVLELDIQCSANLLTQHKRQLLGSERKFERKKEKKKRKEAEGSTAFVADVACSAYATYAAAATSPAVGQSAAWNAEWSAALRSTCFACA